MAYSFAGSERIHYGVAPGTWASGCIAFFFKHTSTSVMVVASVCTTSLRDGFHILANVFGAGKMGLEAYDTSTARVTLSSSAVPAMNDGNWHHFAYNFDTASGNANTLYLDGAQSATVNASGAWPINGVGSAFVNLADDPSAFFTDYVGTLAEYALWAGSTLTADEIAALAKGARPSLIRPDLLEVYAPLVRDTHDVSERALDVLVGGTVADHPRVLGGAI